MDEKKGCNVVTSEKGKSTCRFRGSARLAAMAILGLTVITNGVNTASAEGATTTVGTIEVNTTNNLTFGGGVLLPGTSLTAMDSKTYSISGTIANPTSMAFNGHANTTAYIYANGQLIPEHSFVAMVQSKQHLLVILLKCGMIVALLMVMETIFMLQVQLKKLLKFLQ